MKIDRFQQKLHQQIPGANICVFVCRLEQEKSALQKRAKARPVTTDQVVAAQTADSEHEIEELKKKNSELEAQISTIK